MENRALEKKDWMVKGKVLVVDDSPTIVEMVKLILENAGHEVIIASDGIEALNMARSESPDLIILDVMLPKMQGYQVCRLLKFDENYRDIPIIMYTAKGQNESKDTGMKTGADEYLVKPVDPDVLVETVEKWLGEAKNKT